MRPVAQSALRLARPAVQRVVQPALQLARLAKRLLENVPVKFIQRIQRLIQDRIAAPGLQTDRPFRLPLFLRVVTSLPLLRKLPARIIGYGLRSVRIDSSIFSSPPRDASN